MCVCYIVFIKNNTNTNISANSDKGTFFQAQWNEAFKQDPDIVFIDGWNEWIGYKIDYYGQIVFVDAFTKEFSRDIEPMKGGHNDNYYWQMIANIRRYKGAPPLPEPSEPASIRIAGSFAQWKNVSPEFHDHTGETIPRDFDGASGLRYTNRTGRNDIVAAKVARDTKNVYFYVRTREPITRRTDPNWMWLLIDADQDARTGWEGCDFIANRSIDTDGTSWLEKNDGGWKWTKVAKISLRADGRELHAAIPRSALALPAGETDLSIDFKWADNLQRPGDAMDFYLSGDVAPEGRFMYRYSTRRPARVAGQPSAAS